MGHNYQYLLLLNQIDTKSFLKNAEKYGWKDYTEIDIKFNEWEIKNKKDFNDFFNRKYKLSEDQSLKTLKSLVSSQPDDPEVAKYKHNIYKEYDPANDFRTVSFIKFKGKTLVFFSVSRIDLEKFTSYLLTLLYTIGYRGEFWYIRKVSGTDSAYIKKINFKEKDEKEKICETIEEIDGKESMWYSTLKNNPPCLQIDNELRKDQAVRAKNEKTLLVLGKTFDLTKKTKP